MIPILLQTLANYASFDAAGAFSGPIVRGDIETVKKHLRVLAQSACGARSLRGTSGAAVRYLPGKNKTTLRKALKSAR